MKNLIDIIGQMKKIIAAVLVLGLVTGCQTGEEVLDFKSFQGETMGTVYSITAETNLDPKEIQADIDSLLVVLNDQLSTYIPESTISRFNQSKEGIEVVTSREPFFVENLLISGRIFEESEGLFDPTVMPLVNYWGFGYLGHEPPGSIDSFKVDSLLNYVGFERINYEVDEITTVSKEKPGVKLDFSAVAKGYAVDILASYFEQNGIDNYLVDIGGEVCVQGAGRRGSGWILGISTPDPTAEGNSLSERFLLNRGCVATSGNYRNFRVVDEVMIGHTLNPQTGLPEVNNLLSVTIWTSTAAVADAYATAAMVAGYPRAKDLVEGIEGIEAYFIYIDEEGEIQYSWTEDFSQFLVQDN